jgi:tRNA pseudouridine55 synthase
MRNQPPKPDGPTGVLIVDKGQNMTSHDVVAVARKQLNMKKIGHCGTLDPMATGLLILVTGKATKIQDLLMAEDKEYIGTATLGVTTHTQDKEGDVLDEKPVPDLSDEQIKEAFESFTGEFDQMPPMVSAIKKDGVKLYKLARQGKTIERDPRRVHVTGYEITRTALPEIDFIVQCSKGFYVRTYANDIGDKLGCGGHLSALRRTRSGKFTVEGAITFDELKVASRDEITARMLSLKDVSILRGA